MISYAALPTTHHSRCKGSLLAWGPAFNDLIGEHSQGVREEDIGDEEVCTFSMHTPHPEAVVQRSDRAGAMGPWGAGNRGVGSGGSQIHEHGVQGGEYRKSGGR